MPPRLSTPPDPQDPAYQSLERKINLMFHGALFAAVNSGLWFFDQFLSRQWFWLPLFSTVWGTILLTHALWVISKRRIS
ncbi:MAG: hypothetical protein CV045_10010 [Cyanobacteria bacterium M5B4]|nr:2TM domain-containing protein [Cyanobacteria bacterium KgW148]PLS68070.1 MAG: hypothetical protein CV045_10010 [Cyanobacteria bacterium M5B4]